MQLRCLASPYGMHGTSLLLLLGWQQVLGGVCDYCTVCCAGKNNSGSRRNQQVDEDYPEPRGKNRTISRFGAEHKQQLVSNTDL